MLLAIGVLLFLILVHELGHYVAGRLLKFKITEFSIGFGKAIWSRTNKRGEKISLRIFPLGGYCAFAGEIEEEPKRDADGNIIEEEKKEEKVLTKEERKLKKLEEKSQRQILKKEKKAQKAKNKGKKVKKPKSKPMVYDEKDGHFNNYKPWKRMIVFFAGIFMNFVVAIIFSLISLCTIGGRDIVQVEKIDELSGISQVLQVNDAIYEMNGEKFDMAFGSSFNVALSNVLSQANSAVANNEIASIEDFRFSAKVKRDDEFIILDDLRLYELAKTDTNKDGVIDDEDQVNYSLGVQLDYYVHTFVEALARCWSYAFGLAWMVLKTLWLLITFQLGIDAIGGPITTIATMATITQTSFSNLLLLIPLISANLAVFNLLPLPALDGSKMVFTGIEWARGGRPINRNIENMIHFVGLCVLFGLVILIDILHFAL